MDPQRWREIRAVFGELVELEDDQRAERLAALAAGDTELHDAVESLLAADAASSGRLVGAAIPRRDGQWSGRMPHVFGLSGQTLSHFRVLEPLGAGGMGVVYRAEDTRLGRAVALKFLLPQYTLDPSAKHRFLAEARSAGALDHPNICTIYEVGESEDARLFLAMPLYPGETLDARLARDGPLPVAEALAIAQQIAQGLACAHEAGIVHRDLKPGNLMLLPDRTVKILDFGVAKARDLSLTRSGERLGTVAYMAPEQVRGEPVDARADLWALGVVLYEMLTGRKPFVGEHETAIAHAIVNDEPIRPSALQANISPAVEEIVLTALCKAPESRYAGAPEFLKELSTIHLGGEPTPRPRWHWLRRRSKRTLAGRLVLGGATLLLVGGLATRPLWEEGAEGTPVERSIAVLPFTSMSSDMENEYLADGITEEIVSTLANLARLRVISRTSVMQYKRTSQPARQIAAELGVAHLLEGSVQRSGQQVRIRVQLIDARTDAPRWSKQYDRPLEDVFAVQSEIAREIANVLRVSLDPAEHARIARLPTTNQLAHEYVLQARNLLQDRSVPSIEAAINLSREAVVLDPSYSDAFVAHAFALGLSYWWLGEATRLDSAVVAAEHAIRLDPAFAPAHSVLGWALAWQGERSAALESHRRAVMLNPNLTDGLADLYTFSFGRLDEGARWWRRALETDPINTLTLKQAGRNYLNLGMPAQARVLFDRVRELEPGYQGLRYYTSAAFLVEGRPQEAQAEIQSMLTDSRDNPDALLSAGHILAGLGDLATARSNFERGLAGSSSRLDKEQAGLTLAWILQRSGERERAQVLLEEAVGQFEIRKRGQRWRPEDYVESARIRVVAGDREGAIRELREAVQNGWRLLSEPPNDPILGSLQGEARYDRLVTEVRADLDRQRARVVREGW
jgi:serine/threonine protein kinase/Tfp pilus assembly protein PilF